MQTTGLNRTTIDKFYTKPIVAKNCCDIIKEYISIDFDNDIIIEPSAGNGSFISELKTMSSTCIFYDIQPDNDEIIKQDYLTLINPTKTTNQKIHIIGNPPFGRQSSLANKFIKKSAEFCDTISFILPKSFKKDSMQRYFPTNFHLIYQTDLDENSFQINENEEKDVPCVFQIWEKRDYNRLKIIKEESDYFEFVKRDEMPDLSFRRVGVYAGKIDTENLEEKSIQSHYFIKLNEGVHNKLELIDKMKTMIFETDNTVGPKSISKQEIICAFNKLTI